ncbi:hydroxymethylbilane synthase [Neomoorella humiferrea]|uniref:Porphobilinogen deaminase n=1 Tax=Neomoorella humiferrea TaxID=676965 RepID=A0A2T0AQH4_9FIRM|nr:hydroxymethylbilane synthase [Moorella humiferrea]PRR71179.1 Porphobilinogen deaminase [Moorella humiferrea]
MREIKVGSRDSELARWQARWVIESLAKAWPDLTFRLITFKTKGDKILDVALARIGDKGLFTKELEVALMDGVIDMAVHSMKDMPTSLPKGLKIGAVGRREEPADVLISPAGYTLNTLPIKARVGTSSLRRKAQLAHFRPDLELVDIRGNVPTRLAKMEREGLAAIVLAAAGLKRLNLNRIHGETLPYSICLPAVGQGAIGVEIRADDEEMARIVAAINHAPTAAAVYAERAFLRSLEGGCQVPIGALATVEGEAMIIQGMVASLDGRRVLRDFVSAATSAPEAAGRELARKLLDRGAGTILEEVKLKGGNA